MRNIITGLIITIVFFSAGFATALYFQKPVIQDRVVIKEIEKPTTRIIKVVDREDLSGLYACYKEPIRITYSMPGNTDMHISASDGCKSTDQNIKLEIKTQGNWKLYAGVGAGALVIGGITGFLLHK